MAMLAFDSRCPETATRETRIISIPLPDQAFPVGTYLLREFYCPDRACDCRRVIIRIIQVDPQGDPEKPEATLTYGWGSKAHCRKWFGDTVPESELDFHLTLNLELLSYQSPRAEEWLELVTDLVFSDPDYVARLGKHYRLFRSVGTKPVKGSSMRRFRPR